MGAGFGADAGSREGSTAGSSEGAPVGSVSTVSVGDGGVAEGSVGASSAWLGTANKERTSAAAVPATRRDPTRVMTTE